MMNNVAFVEAARFLAERVLNGDARNPSQRVSLAFRIVTSRAHSAGGTE